MKQLLKRGVPDFFTKFIAKNDPGNWEDISPVRQELREHLLKEQGNCCAYTEIRLAGNESCHIDHYYTRNLFPQKTFEYDNMLVSCNSEKYGAKYKDKQIKTVDDYNNLVNPVEDPPSDYLEFSFTGELIPTGGCVKGKKTISFFNLNEKTLIERRKTMVTCLLQMKNDLTEDEMVESIGGFETMTRQLYKDCIEETPIPYEHHDNTIEF